MLSWENVHSLGGAIHQFFIGNVKNLNECLKLDICYISLVVLDSRNDVFIYIISQKLKLMGQIPLGKIVFLSQLGQIFADQIFLSGVGAWFRHKTTSLVESFVFFSLMHYNQLIGCESETNHQNYLGEFNMKREDIELYAFLFFCGVEERDLILGKKTVTYKDFCRLLYLADFLGLDNFFPKLWDMFGERFYDSAEKMERFLTGRREGEDTDEALDGMVAETMAEQEQWLLDFCNNTQNWKKKRLQKIVRDICDEKGLLIDSINGDGV